VCTWEPSRGARGKDWVLLVKKVAICEMEIINLETRKKGGPKEKRYELKANEYDVCRFTLA
jgi:hypothetical protein